MQRFKKILVYTGSARASDPATLRALNLAKSNEATVELVDVIEELPAYARMLTPLTWDVAGLMAAEREKNLDERVDQFLSGFASLGRDAHVKLVKGEPENAIIEFVAKRNVDLVVMGTLCRTGISGYLIGNTAEKVLRHLGTSVLAVKPGGFESPVSVPAYQTATYEQHV